MTLLFAQTEWIAPVSAIGSVVANVGFSALVGWFLLTKAIPNMQKEHKDAIAEQRRDFLKEILQKRVDYLGDDKDRRDTFRAAMVTVTEHCERESSRRDAAFREEMSLVIKTMNDMGEVLEEVRDSLREFRIRRRKLPPLDPNSTENTK